MRCVESRPCSTDEVARQVKSDQRASHGADQAPQGRSLGERPRILPWMQRGHLHSNTDPGVMVEPEIWAWLWRWLAFSMVMGKFT